MSRVSVGRLAPVDGLFTSESVADGHPDKIADQLSDALLDAALRQDPGARVAVEAAIKGSSVWLFGELTGRDLCLDFPEIVRGVLSGIGHSDDRWGIDVAQLAALRPWAIIERLALTTPGFLPTAAFGHFGRSDFAWEMPAPDSLLIHAF